jgi:hypothetical protein
MSLRIVRVETPSLAASSVPLQSGRDCSRERSARSRAAVSDIPRILLFQ